MKKLFFTTLVIINFISVRAQVLGFNYAKSLSGAQLVNPYDMKVDSVNNFIYITGLFYGNTDFDFSPSVVTLSTVVNSIPSIYIAKYDLNSNLIWAKCIGNNQSTNLPNKINFDATGNVILVGRYSGTLDFDPSPSTSTLSGTSAGFILKLDNGGNFVYAKSLAGGGTTNILDVEVDAANDFYITGPFSNVIDFDPSPTTYTLDGSLGGNTSSAYIAKYSTSGNLVYVKHFDGVGSGGTIFSDIILTSTDIFCTGNFNGIRDFDPSVSTTTLTSSPSSGFLARFDISGNYVWVKQLANSNGLCNPISIRKKNQKIYTCGNFNGIVDFDGSPTTFTLNSGSTTTNVYNVFTTCYDLSGNFIWANNFGGLAKPVNCGEMLINSSGKLLITGWFSSTNTDFDPGIGTQTLSTLGSNDIYINMLDSLGNFNFVYRVGSTSSDGGSNIAMDGNSLFNYGVYSGNADFDVTAGIFNLSPVGANSAAYISRYNIVNSPNADFSISQTTICQNGCVNFTDNSTNSVISWAWTFVGASNTTTSNVQNPSNICYNAIGIYTIQLSTTNIAGMSMVTKTLNVSACTGIEENNLENSFNLYPNPTTNNITINVLVPIDKLEILNVVGELLISKNSLDEKYVIIDLSGLPNGVYFIRSETEHGIVVKKVVKE
ncbi:MAG: T9SS type A sorting domain-containing protein [Bacteroidia bacterium]|nr:T9SS type A sorting domain-containing protein [Bacteroidia bacterium]